MQSFIFPEKVLLNSIHKRIPKTNNYNITDYYTFNKKELAELTNKNLPFLNQDIFCLTSDKTFSAAEEFCYNIQSRKRGKIVGKITRGGANPGKMFDLHDDIRITIPTGYARNPITETNWEGKGIIPDIQIDSGDQLDYILLDFVKELGSGGTASYIYFGTK